MSEGDEVSEEPRQTPEPGEPERSKRGGAHLRLAGREIVLPESPTVRIAIGSALVAGGVVGFLPLVGFWMIPVGLAVLGTALPPVRRFNRKVAARFRRRFPRLWERLSGS